jgi:hypothetical protein
MKRRTLVLSLAACLLAAAPCRGQTPSRASLVAQLRSPDPAVRSRAFDALNRSPAIWSEPAMQTILVELVERENKLIDTGAAGALGEGYAEYDALVLDNCLK